MKNGFSNHPMDLSFLKRIQKQVLQFFFMFNILTIALVLVLSVSTEGVFTGRSKGFPAVKPRKVR